MPPEDVRVHVKQAIRRVKEFHILQNVLPSSIWDSTNEVILYVACYVTSVPL